MANTSFSSGFATGYSITSNWKANKEKKEMIKKQEEESKAFALDLGARYDRDMKNGTGISRQEYDDGYRWAMIAGTEQLNVYKDLYGNAMDMSKQELVEELTMVKEYQSMYADVDLKDRDGLREIMKGLKYEKSKNLAKALEKSWQAEEAQIKDSQAKEPEYFTSLPELKKQYGENAEGKFAQGKGWIYSGEKESSTASPSDYVNMLNSLGAVAATKTDDEFQAFKTKMEQQTGIELGDINRQDLLEVKPDEIKAANFDTVFFGSHGIMTEYQDSAQELDDEAKKEIARKWRLRRGLMNSVDQQKGDNYLAGIGIDANMDTTEPVDDVDADEETTMEKLTEGASKLIKWVEEWSDTMPVTPETKGGMAP